MQYNSVMWQHHNRHGSKCGRIWNVYHTIRKWTQRAHWHLHCRRLIRAMLTAAMAPSAWWTAWVAWMAWMAYIRIGRHRWRTQCCIQQRSQRNKSTTNQIWYASRNFYKNYFYSFSFTKLLGCWCYFLPHTKKKMIN